MKTLSEMFNLKKAEPESDIGTYVVAIQLSKDKIHTMTLSWRPNTTRENAIKECLEYAAKVKPGFTVDQYLVDKIP
jgi:hypothetical protein